MMNNYMVVGRLVADPEVKELDGGKKVSNITIAVPRSYKNEQGVYDTDFIDCTLWGDIAQTTSEYCKKGDMIGVRGRVETNIYEKEDGSKQKDVHVVAERITFLTSKDKTKEDNEPEME